MKYCKYHDLGFCDQHLGQCLRPDCELVEDARATFCCICSGTVMPRNEEAIDAARAAYPEPPTPCIIGKYAPETD